MNWCWTPPLEVVEGIGWTPHPEVGIRSGCGGVGVDVGSDRRMWGIWLWDGGWVWVEGGRWVTFERGGNNVGSLMAAIAGDVATGV